MPAARCYSGSRDQVEIDQEREYISAVFFSGSLGGESSPPKFHISPPKFEVVNDCYQNVQYTTTIFELFSPPTLLS